MSLQLVRQDPIDRGEMPGTTSIESRESRKGRRRIGELETEVESFSGRTRCSGTKRAAQQRPSGDRSSRGHRVLRNAPPPGPRCLESGRPRVSAPAALTDERAREWLTAPIAELHTDPRDTTKRAGYAELTKFRGLHVRINVGMLLTHNVGIVGHLSARKSPERVIASTEPGGIQYCSARDHAWTRSTVVNRQSTMGPRAQSRYRRF